MEKIKKAMVFGGGISGIGATKLLEAIGYNVILVDDKVGIPSCDGVKMLDEIELFIKSPGVPYTEIVMKAKEKGIKVINEVELGYQYMLEYDIKSKIIAITGTNGKTTTTSKIAEILSFAGYKTHIAGNIGVSFAEVLLKYKDLDYIVLELSSYQLENIIDFKPYISMVINLTPDHLSRYKSVDDYYDTKFNICKNQDNGFFILNIDSKEILERKNRIKSNIITVTKEKKKADFYVKNKKLFCDNDEIIEIEKLSLKGKHNLENVLFIVAVAHKCGVKNEKIKEFLYNTKSLEHRMEEFFTYGKVKFINDSKGTNIDSTKFAIEAFRGCTLICGGYDKKLDWTPLIKLICDNVKNAYLIGDIAEELQNRLLKMGYPSDKIFCLKELKKCLEDIKTRISKNNEEVILFSPATSSFDQFKNFEHRGKVFKELVKEIFGR